MVDMYSKHPSFSSTLLDAIYRSIDQGDEEICGETRRKRELQHCVVEAGGVLIQRKEESVNYQRVSAGKVTVRENSVSGPCASLDGDGFYGKRLKPIRVWDSGLEKDHKKSLNKNQEAGFSKKNSRTLKMYAGLKKVKQPISPGAARLAGFLNSLFSKKPTINNPDINSPISKSEDSSTCSSASSFSRSCLSKTPSCRGKPSGGEKRSVRFSPVSVILNQNSQSCANKNQKLGAAKNSIITPSNIDERMLLHAKEMNRKVEEAATDLLRNYQKKIDSEFPFDLRKSQIKNQVFDEDSEEDDDAASYASSDLFELDNLSAIGMERYREELPVYETTRLPSNGLIIL